MFFSCSSNSWFRRLLTSFCRANSSCCCFAICINVENDSKDVLDFKSAIIFFFEIIIFHSWKSVYDFMNFVTTNLKTSRIVCCFFAKYNLILIQRVKSIFLFLYFHFAIRSSCDVFTIFTCVAFFMLVDNVEIIMICAMFFRACIVYDNNFTIFIDMIVFLTRMRIKQHFFEYMNTLLEYKNILLRHVIE
jgi:hypothetical protein